MHTSHHIDAWSCGKNRALRIRIARPIVTTKALGAIRNRRIPSLSGNVSTEAEVVGAIFYRSRIKCGMRFGFIVLLLLVGCTQANPAATCTSGTCSDPAFPYCDSDGVIAGTPGQCLAVSCTPGEIRACAGGKAVTCNAAGNGYDKVACSHDCLSSPQPHCDYLEPKWLPNACDTLASIDSFMPDASTTFDSSVDSNCNGGIVAQTSPGPQICVVRAKTIVLPTLTVVGNRPIAFVADDAISITGFVDAGASFAKNGPGGGVISSGKAPGSLVGGGGAGFGQQGADGAANAGSGGAPFDPTNLPYFAGGPHAVGSSGTAAVGGGGGGGGLLFASCRGATTVLPTAVIDLRGGGGLGQHDTTIGTGTTLSDCGGGGGAGGYLVIQGLTGVSVAGNIYANGGGGGGGSTCGDPPAGFPGSDGQRSITMQASGGMPCGSGGYGGLGGIEGTLAVTGSGSSGGGGGSIGVVHVFTPTGVTPAITSANLSPVPTVRQAATR